MKQDYAFKDLLTLDTKNGILNSFKALDIKVSREGRKLVEKTNDLIASVMDFFVYLYMLTKNPPKC